MNTKEPKDYMTMLLAVGLFCIDKIEDNQSRKYSTLFRMSNKSYFSYESALKCLLVLIRLLANERSHNMHGAKSAPCAICQEIGNFGWFLCVFDVRKEKKGF